MKRYANTALVYAVLAAVAGVFYREFTKIQGFTGRTTLSMVHTHYFALGMLLFLVLLALEKQLAFTDKAVGRVLVVFHLGLNVTAVTLLARGVVQVLGTPVSTALNASLSGVAGIGHILLGVSLILLLLRIRKCAGK